MLKFVEFLRKKHFDIKKTYVTDEDIDELKYHSLNINNIEIDIYTTRERNQIFNRLNDDYSLIIDLLNMILNLPDASTVIKSILYYNVGSLEKTSGGVIINFNTETKQKISIYTKNDKFCIVSDKDNSYTNSYTTLNNVQQQVIDKINKLKLH